jgi:hypothetical protein
MNVAGRRDKRPRRDVSGVVRAMPKTFGEMVITVAIWIPAGDE